MPSRCWVQPGWRESGLAVVVVARRQADGRVVWGSLLVDHYCLGVKDCMCKANTPYREFVDVVLPELTQGGPPQPLSTDLAHELIYDSIEYAARGGFEPHPDFATCQALLDPPDAHPRRGEVTFGKNGKSFYIEGPYDDASAIMAQLDRTAGPGQYHILMGIDEHTSALGPDADEEWLLEDYDDEDSGPVIYFPRR